MEAVTSSAWNNFKNKITGDLTSRNPARIGFVIILVGALFLLLNALGFRNQWWCNILMIVVVAITFILELPSLFKCCSWYKQYEDKFKMLDNHIIKGSIYTVLSIVMYIGAYGLGYVVITVYLIGALLYIVSYILELIKSKSSDATQSMV